MRPLLSRIVMAALVLCGPASASALSVTQFSPEGMMARITRVQADFDAPAVALGDDGAADPFLVACDDDTAKGSGRWTDPQHWIYVFDAPLAGAVSCQARPNPDFRDLQGQPLAGEARRFATGGPRARLVRPWSRTISEDQVFVLRFNAAPDTRSLLERTHCEVEGLGEAVPTRLVTGADRERILKAVTGSAGTDAWDDARLLQCKRLLPSKARVRLVVAPGVRSAGLDGRPGVPSTVGLAEDFEVRTAFNAVMSCTRTNAQAPCSPLFPVLVAFSRPVPRDLAARVALEAPQGPRVARQFGPEADDPSDDAIETLQFDPPFEERSTLTLTLPDALRDDMGMPLANADRFPLTIRMDAMPPLAKFASGEFGIVERFAEGAPGQDRPALAPLALRRVEPQLQTRESDTVCRAGARPGDHGRRSGAAMVCARAQSSRRLVDGRAVRRPSGVADTARGPGRRTPHRRAFAFRVRSQGRGPDAGVARAAGRGGPRTSRWSASPWPNPACMCWRSPRPGWGGIAQACRRGSRRTDHACALGGAGHEPGGPPEGRA